MIKHFFCTQYAPIKLHHPNKFNWKGLGKVNGWCRCIKKYFRRIKCKWIASLQNLLREQDQDNVKTSFKKYLNNCLQYIVRVNICLHFSLFNVVRNFVPPSRPSKCKTNTWQVAKIDQIGSYVRYKVHLSNLSSIKPTSVDNERLCNLGSIRWHLKNE